MMFSTARVMLSLTMLLVLFIGIICLQIYLSKRQSKIPGMVLPVISFFFGLLYPLNMMAPAGGMDGPFMISMLSVWVIGNIPTFVLLTIYFAQREKIKKFRELEQMKLHDL